MAEQTTLNDAVKERGPYAVWDLMNEDEQKAAAIAFWTGADREGRAALEIALAKELKFRTQSVRQLSAERVAGRLVRLADSLPDSVLFQYLFHFHMAERRALMGGFLDAVGLPHEDGALDLPDDFEGPDVAKVESAGRELVESKDREALVYLATLMVADDEFWEALEPVLGGYASDGSKA